MGKDDFQVEKAKALDEATELIRSAAVLISPLGEGFERVAWMLEDAITYIQQAEEKQDAAWSKERERRTLDNIERLVETVTTVNGSNT